MGIPPSYRRGERETTSAASCTVRIPPESTGTVPPRSTLRSTNTASLHHQTYTSITPLAHPRIRICASTPNAISGPPASELVRLSFTRPKCSYGMSFYLLRAASKAGAYAELFPSLVRSWQKMVEDNLITWAEDDVVFHSDCHD